MNQPTRPKSLPNKETVYKILMAESNKIKTGNPSAAPKEISSLEEELSIVYAWLKLPPSEDLIEDIDRSDPIVQLAEIAAWVERYRAKVVELEQTIVDLLSK